MWSQIGIIAVSVVVTVTVLVLGILVTIVVERRRQRIWLRQHGYDREPRGNHQTQLSPGGRESELGQCSNNRSNTTRSQISNSTSNFGTGLDYNESTLKIDQDSKVTVPLKKKETIRCQPSLRVMKQNRLRKSRRNFQMEEQRSPLSDIAEFTDSSTQHSPIVVELPAQRSCENLRETQSEKQRDYSLRSISATKSRNKNSKDYTDALAHSPPTLSSRDASALEEDYILPAQRQRRPSCASTYSTAPDEPLPPLPIFKLPKYQDIYTPRKHMSIASSTSIGSSILDIEQRGNPVRENQKPKYNLTSDRGIEKFEFDWNHLPPISYGLTSAARRATHNNHDVEKQNNILCAHPSVRFYNDSKTFRHHCNQTCFLQTPSTDWDLNQSYVEVRDECKKVDQRHSMYEKSSFSYNYSIPPIGSERDSTNLSKSFDTPPRPLSIASGYPFLNGFNSELVRVQYSTDSQNSQQSSQNGQNYAKVANFPRIDQRRTRKYSGILKSAIEQHETASRTDYRINTKHGPPSTIAETIPSPFENIPILLPSNSSASFDIFQTTSSNDSNISEPKLDIFSSSQHSITNHITKADLYDWPLSPISPNVVKSNPMRPQPDLDNHNSPILPSPIVTSASIFRHQSRILNPQRISNSRKISRMESPTPSSNRSIRHHNDEEMDMRKSGTIPRSMNSESMLMDQSNRFYYNIENFDTKREPISGINRHLSTSNPTRSSTRRSNALGQSWLGVTASTTNVAKSPSATSVSNISIWEDVSVRGDSPSPDILSQSTAVPEQKYQYEFGTSKQGLNPYAQIRIRNDDDKSFQGMSPRRKGLGFRMNGMPPGTPKSLYDVEGFLKE